MLEVCLAFMGLVVIDALSDCLPKPVACSLGLFSEEGLEFGEGHLERFGVTFPTVRDPERKVSLRYGTMKYPESYLIDRQGVVIRKYINAQDWEHPEIVNYVRSVL